MPSLASDIDLINSFRRGDETAVKQLYTLHYQALCYYADRMIRNKEEAEDIAVESFLKLLQKKDDFDKLRDIESFLFTATRNLCIDLLRRTKRREQDHQTIAFLHDADKFQEDKEMVTAMVLQTIYAEIEHLPQQCKLVFRSIFIDGKTTAQIAADMGISPQTVLNQKTKALNILRNKLDQEGLTSTGVFFYCLYLLSTSGKG
jgi:RNA polymerase sigma-70 factor (family 1)